jgi:hypothetical protein
MDEFAHYHALGCAAFPLSREGNVYRESCRAEDLALPGTGLFLPLRSYAYIGSLPVVPFYPFWRLLGDPRAARIQGACFFVLAVLLTSRLARAPLGTALLASLLFPLYPLLFLDDLGPNGLTILLDLGALFALRRGLRTGGALWPAGLLLFLGFFTKPVFALYLPALVLFGIGEWRGSPRRTSPAALLGGAAAFLVPALLLLFSVDREGHLYGTMIRRASLSSSPGSVGEVFGAMGGYLAVASRVVPRTLTLEPRVLDALPLLVGGLLFASRKTPGRMFLAMAALTFLLTLGIGAASEPHHAAFTFCPLVLALAARLGECPPLLRRGTLVACLLTLTSLGNRWPRAQVNPDTGPDKDRLLASLRRSSLGGKTVQVHASWGTYYIAHLFGDPAQAVVYLPAASAGPAELAEVRSFALAHGRGILLVSQGAAPEGTASSWGTPTGSETFGPWSYTLFWPGAGHIIASEWTRPSTWPAGSHLRWPSSGAACPRATPPPWSWATSASAPESSWSGGGS